MAGAVKALVNEKGLRLECAKVLHTRKSFDFDYVWRERERE